MDWIYLIGLLVVLLFTSSIVILLFADSDIVTFLAERFGKKPDVYKGKVVWVTGASSGIGEGIAKELAKVGAKVVLTARRKEELERVKGECLKLNSRLKDGDILVLPLDMIDYSAHEPALNTILKRFGKLDLLISNAGQYQKGEWEKIDMSVDKYLFDVNVFSVINMNRLVVRHFLESGGGHVAVVSSLAGKAPNPFSGPYTASKHALHGYFNTLRMEVAGKNIDVSLICPGPVDTPIFASAILNKPGEFSGENNFPEFIEIRMTSERCSYLTLVSTANRLSESWLARLPLMPMLYALTYFPFIVDRFSRLTNPLMMKQLRSRMRK